MSYLNYCWNNRYLQLFVAFTVAELWNLIGDDPWDSDYADPYPHLIPVAAIIVILIGSYLSWKKKFK